MESVRGKGDVVVEGQLDCTVHVVLELEGEVMRGQGGRRKALAGAWRRCFSMELTP